MFKVADGLLIKQAASSQMVSSFLSIGAAVIDTDGGFLMMRLTLLDAGNNLRRSEPLGIQLCSNNHFQHLHFPSTVLSLMNTPSSNSCRISIDRDLH